MASDTLTIDQALALADRYNARLRAGSAAIEGAQAGIATARSYANPTITFGSLGRQQALMREAIPGVLHGLNFSQAVELPSVRSTRIRAAEIRQQTTKVALSETRLAVRGAVKQAFYDALRRKHEVELSQGNLDLLEDLKRRIQVQVEVGEAARLELTRAEAEVASARIGVQSAELRLSAAMSELYAAIGAPLGRVELVGDPDSTEILPPLETLRDEMLARHPSLALAESQVRYAEANLSNERAQRLPQPSVWMDWFQQPEAAQYRFGITIPLPIWNRREGPIAEAQAAQRQASAVADNRRVELLAALERAYSMYHIATQQLEIFETGTLRQAAAAVEAAQAAFKYGERGIIEVLDAQRVLRAARLDYLNARFDRRQALIELEQLRAID
jgi:cobalt-zinc-cadmium efflux system outer membrane protein